MNSNCFAIFFSAAFLLSAVQISIYLMQTSGLVPLLYQIYKLTIFYLITPKINKMFLLRTAVSVHDIPSGKNINHLLVLHNSSCWYFSQGINKTTCYYTLVAFNKHQGM